LNDESSDDDAEYADDDGGVGECPELGSIGCLNDESSDDDAEHADDDGDVGECPELGSIGCLNDESSDDDAEYADDDGGMGECPERTRALLECAPEDATETSNLAIADDV
jgi:hypothetical protein